MKQPTHAQAASQAKQSPQSKPSQTKVPYQPQQVFQAETDALTSDGSQSSEQDLFSPSTVFHEAHWEPLVPHPEETGERQDIDLEDYIRPSKRRYWFRRLMAGLFVGMVGWQASNTLWQAVEAQDWLTLGWTGFLTLMAGAGVVHVARQWWQTHRLGRHFIDQQTVADLIAAQSVGQAKPMCDHFIHGRQAIFSSTDLAQWTSQFNTAYNDAEVFQLFDQTLMQRVDQKALQLIASSAVESAALVAVSPLALTDMLFVAWRQMTMIQKLAVLYGMPLGYWASIRLLRHVLMNMLAAGASELAIDAGTELLSVGVLGKLSSRAAQGVGVGFLTARLGFQTMALLRPLPWVTDKKQRFAQVRQAVVQKVKSLTHVGGLDRD